MNKKLKAAIFAAALFSLGGAAYTYNQYGTQDNSMILENIEALTRVEQEICEGIAPGAIYQILDRGCNDYDLKQRCTTQNTHCSCTIPCND